MLVIVKFLTSLPQGLTGEGGVGTISPNTTLYSQSYPSIYHSGAVIAQAAGQHGNGEREREMAVMIEEAGRGRDIPGIGDLEEECEEEEDMDERSRNLNETAGEHSSVGLFFLSQGLNDFVNMNLSLLQECFPWMRTLCLVTVNHSLSPMERRRALMVSVCV